MAAKAKSEVESTDPFAVTPVGNGGVPASPGDMVGVDKIRDLLFGNQMQDYDRRFSKLEERFLQRFKDMEAETTRSFGAHETNSKKQFDSLTAQLREEKDVRGDADKDLDRNLREHNQTLEKRLRALSDQVAQLERDLSDRLSREAQALHDEIKRRNDDAQHALERMFAELSNVKTDRNLLAGLFVEVARCLNQEAGPKAKTAAEMLHG